MPHRPENSTTATFRALERSRARLAARDEATIATQIALAQIAAPTGDEGERARRVEHSFHERGLGDVHVDAAGNVIGRRYGTRDLPPVVVCAHLDTVFPRGTDLVVRRDGIRLEGPGITDNSRGLAAMLVLASELDGRRVRTSRPIEFVATTGEEGIGDLRGAKHYFATRGVSAAAAIAIDGAGDERVIHRALGSRRFRLRFTGPGGHSWAAYGAPNAVHAAAFAASRLATLVVPTIPRTTLSVNRIGGGLSVNSIPGEAWIEVDLRSTASDVLATLSQEVMRIAHAALEEENARRSLGAAPLEVAIDLIGDRPGGATAPEDPLVRAALDATALVGRRPDLALASTDANIPIAQGIPAIAIGAGGRGGDAHTTGEWFENVEGHVGIARALTIIASVAGLAAD